MEYQQYPRIPLRRSGHDTLNTKNTMLVAEQLVLTDLYLSRL